MHAEIGALRKSLERRVGVSIDSISRCRQVENWLREFDIQVSYSTLSRMFGLNQNPVQPRIQTLDALARAVGFQDFDTFCNRQHPRPSVLRFQNDLLFQLEVYLTNGETMDAVHFFLRQLKENTRNCFLALHLGKHLYTHKDRFTEELKTLADHRLGRMYFYQFYVDEDDLNGVFEYSLKKHFLPTAQKEEAFFVRLFCTRKEVMRGKVLSTYYIDELKQYVPEFTSLHLKSRAWEIIIINEYLLHGCVQKETLDDILQSALSELSSLNYRGEEYSVVGRICRAMLYTKSGSLVFDNYDWITACRQVVFGTFCDLEFQSAAQRFLQQGSSFLSNQQMIYQSDWPNAYFTTQIFLQSNSSIRQNIYFFSQCLGIDIQFLENLVNVPPYTPGELRQMQ